MNNPVYLDYNATAPLRPQAREAMLEVLKTPSNASAVHSFGREARALIEKARDQCARAVGVSAGQVIFNSGATEGNNTVLKHFSNERVLVSAIEHASVAQAIPGAVSIPVTRQGVVDLNALEDLLKTEKTSLVSVMMVNNETGIIQPLGEVINLARKYGALVHCDAVQALGRIEINLNTIQIDFMTVSSHKAGGPIGCGALILGFCGITPSLLHGGGQEKKARSGTENTAAIAGFGAALEGALKEIKTTENKMRGFQDLLEKELCTIDDSFKVYGQDVERVANTTLFTLPALRSDSWLINYDLEGIAISNGSACSSGSVQPSHVLKAMGVQDDAASGALRVSTGWATTSEDIARFLEVTQKVYNRLNKRG